jgi:hypothetical protein
MKHKAVFAALVLPLVFSACASEDLVTLDGMIEERGGFPYGPAYPIIVTPDDKVYTILPPEEAERIFKTRGLKGHPIRFKVRHLKEKYRGNWWGEYIEGTVTPVSWEILDPLTGEVIKNHRLRRSRWSW